MMRFVVLSACFVAAMGRPQEQVVQLPAGVSAASCPNYPLCAINPAEASAFDISIFTPAQQVATVAVLYFMSHFKIAKKISS